MTDLERELEVCRRAAKAGVFQALIDAVLLCGHAQAPMPEWLGGAVVGTLTAIQPHAKLAGRRTKGANALTTHEQNLDHYRRWDLVKQCREAQLRYRQEIRPVLDRSDVPATRRDAIKANNPDPGRTWIDAFNFCAAELNCSADTVKRSYQLVERSQKPGQNGERFYLSRRKSG
jgi:hypothetical protein